MVEPLAMLSELKATFLTGSGREEGIVDRIDSHLYHIQNKERPDCIHREDSNWGYTAFQGDNLSTPEEKFRAAQRTYVELLLSLIQTARDDSDLREQLQEIGTHPSIRAMFPRYRNHQPA